MRFVLVHGGFHGGWCFERLQRALGDLGHASVAPDLPGHGLRRDEHATLGGYRDAVLDVLTPGDVVVGHSMGGHVVTVVADAEGDRIRHLVYLAAVLPTEGASVLEAGNLMGLHGRPGFDFAADGSAVTITAPETAVAMFYDDCDPADAAWAFSRLSPQPLAPLREKISVPSFWSSAIPRTFLRCANNRAQSASLADDVATRLGVEPLVIDTAHSPFLNQPQLLARMLVDAVGRTG